MTIPVFIIDDEEVDRLIAHHKLETGPRSARFTPIEEFEAGDVFLEKFGRDEELAEKFRDRPLVLMDVNMPRMNGFETIRKLQSKLSCGDGIVVMMFTTSTSRRDMSEAEQLDMVKGYIVKPFDEDDVDRILSIYDQTPARKSVAGLQAPR